MLRPDRVRVILRVLLAQWVAQGTTLAASPHQEAASGWNPGHRVQNVRPTQIVRHLSSLGRCKTRQCARASNQQPSAVR